MGEQVLQQFEQWNYFIGIVATIAFAVTGVLAITEKNDTDLLGAIVFGIIAGIGGMHWTAESAARSSLCFSQPVM